MKPIKLLALGENQTLSEVAQLLSPQDRFFQYQPLEIQALPWLESNQNINWQQQNKIIVVSANAYYQGLALVKNSIRADCPIFTIGEKTAQLIRQAGFQHVFAPTIFTSEALLDLAALQKIINENIIIFKGASGRQLITETLMARGAHCKIIDCYQRTPKTQLIHKAFQTWQKQEVNFLLITSLESFEAFLQQLPPDAQTWLANLTYLVTSQRIEKSVYSKGFKKVRCCHNFSAAAIIMAMNNL